MFRLSMAVERLVCTVSSIRVLDTSLRIDWTSVFRSSETIDRSSDVQKSCCQFSSTSFTATGNPGTKALSAEEQVVSSQSETRSFKL